MGTCRGVETLAADEAKGVLCPASGGFERAAPMLKILRGGRRVLLSKIAQISDARPGALDFLDVRPARWIYGTASRPVQAVLMWLNLEALPAMVSL